jgi:predicted SAM-dependent methyltransferase
MIKLDIGSGGKAAAYLGDGWLGVDMYVDEADINAPMDELPFADGEVDEIFSSHALEHVGKYDVLPVLKEWYRVLKPGGKLTLRVPDLEWCVRRWLERKNSTGWDLDIIFGNQNHSGEFHKTGFTEQTIQQYVRVSGFHIVKLESLQTHGQKTISVEAFR